MGPFEWLHRTGNRSGVPWRDGRSRLAGKAVDPVFGASAGVDSRRVTLGAGCLLVCGLFVLFSAAGRAQETRAFVASGKAEDVIAIGREWEQGEGYLACQGKDNYLFAGQALGSGDATVRVRMALFGVARSAASFDIDGRSHFGFDGGGGQGMFVSGPVFGKLRFIAPYADYIRDGEPFEFVVRRRDRALTFMIDGEEVFSCPDQRPAFGLLALRPWRATMRVYGFSATGTFQKAVLPKALTVRGHTPFSIPTLDLSRDQERQVVIAAGGADAYKGHPTTLLMPDGKTMFCVYPLGHGRPGAVLRRSDDGGLTWSEPLATPESWAESTNCPALYRLVGPDDVARLFVFEGHGHMRQAVSTDGGETWSPMVRNGLQTTMPFTTIIRLRDGRFLGAWNWEKSTWASVSEDGGLTWGPQRVIAAETDRYPGAWPCEPAFIRSPDGDQIACLMRENSRRYFSMVTFSDDEGETWREMGELPRALTGDRHQPGYAADGRLVIPFRDTAPGSPTRDHFVAWVGTYGDIAAGRPGQYRLKLLHSFAGSDCGYPGLELLPDGTFAATTYCKLRPGPEKQSVVSVRFTLSETDDMVSNLPEKIRLLPPGPGNARNSEADFVQLRDGRIMLVYAHYFAAGGDVSPACLMARYSADGGRTWSQEDEVVVPRQGADSIRSVSLLRLADGRIALFYLNCTDWPEDERPWVQFSSDEGRTWTDPRCIIPDADAGYYVTNNDRVVQLESGRLLLPTALHHDPPEKTFTGYGRVMTYLSDDAGASWRRSETVRTGERPDDDRILLQEPGIVELRDGRLMMFCRTDRGCQYVSWSEDQGLNWTPFEPSDIISPRSPASIERLPATGDLLMVWNNHEDVASQYKGKRSPLHVAISRDEGKTWEKVKVLESDPGGHYCYTAIEFVETHVLLAYCAGQRATGGLNLTQVTRFSLDWLYR